jgi:spermidine/putrescine transport system ATP-binding protein
MVPDPAATTAAVTPTTVTTAASREEPVVELDSVTKTFGDTVVVDGVSLTIRRGEFLTLLGPSGCGKTTTLRLIAGFEEPTSGTVRIDGADQSGKPPYERRVNTVFQHYALFPHMTVADNVGFGLSIRRRPAAEVRERVGRALDLVQLAGSERKYPAQLSGGQKQRVALARALVLEPQVLLLDEPLGALDFKLRKEMQVELKGLQRRLGLTFVLVTHDQEEALVLSDRIAVMNRGRIEQVGTAAAIYEAPRTHFVADFLGFTNFLAGTLEGTVDGELRVRSREGALLTVAGAAGASLPGDAAAQAGARVVVGVRPEKVRIARDLEATAPNLLTGTLEETIYVGSGFRFLVRLTQGTLVAAMTPAPPPADLDGMARGSSIELSFDPRHAVALRG